MEGRGRVGSRGRQTPNPILLPARPWQPLQRILGACQSASAANRQVEEALGFLHTELSLVHNDVQGGNIMVRKSAVEKIMEEIRDTTLQSLGSNIQYLRKLPLLKVKLLQQLGISEYIGYKVHSLACEY